MSVNGRTGEVRLANSLLLFEYQRDILGPSRTKSCCDGCESGTGTVRVEVRGAPMPAAPASRWHTDPLASLNARLKALSRPPAANAFASNSPRWRNNSKPDN
jgi:hypothetical protein